MPTRPPASDRFTQQVKTMDMTTKDNSVNQYNASLVATTFTRDDEYQSNLTGNEKLPTSPQQTNN